MAGVESLTADNDAFEGIQFESIHSLNLSDLSSRSSASSSNISRSSFNSTSSYVENYAKRKVLKVIKALRENNKQIHFRPNESKLVMVLYLEMIRDDHYRHVNFNMLEQFMIQSNLAPKSYYLHYYIYFLYYAAFYHRTRAGVDVIDTEMKAQHKKHYICIIAQLKYIQYIINKSKNRNTQTI